MSKLRQCQVFKDIISCLFACAADTLFLWPLQQEAACLLQFLMENQAKRNWWAAPVSSVQIETPDADGIKNARKRLMQISVITSARFYKFSEKVVIALQEYKKYKNEEKVVIKIKA